MILLHITKRNWYFESWKVMKKSGGIETIIGIHLFDLLYYIFGAYDEIKVFHRNKITTIGFLGLEIQK